MAEPRDILHVDMDAFFASVEQLLDPSLKGKPVIVGGDPDARSVVSAASYEARKYGVHSAMPMARAKRLCPHAVFIRGNYAAYGEFSGRVHEILLRFAPVVQVMSVDDFYLDMTGCRRLHGPALTAAERIKRVVHEETGLVVSLGGASNKLVAKVASGMAKPNGIAVVNHGYEAAFLAPLAVERLPGVGATTAATLHKFNLKTVGEVAAMPRDLLERTFGQWGTVLWQHANGMDASDVIADHGPPRSISREHTFLQDTLDRIALETMLYALTERASRQLRREGFSARRVTVKVRYCDFRTVTSARMLDAASDQDNVFYKAARERMSRLTGRGLRVRLIGVALSGIVADSGRQGGLFDEASCRRRRNFYRGLDSLREKFGTDIARVGGPLRELKTD